MLEVLLLGNRVDRFVWTGTNNANPAGNHNVGVMRFGPDGKLYIFMGDQERRGWFQNLANGPFETAPFVDDTLVRSRTTRTSPASSFG